MFAVTLSGKTRQVLTGPGSFKLQDVAPDGRVMLSNGGRRLSIASTRQEPLKRQSSGWIDYSMPEDMSDDGRQMVFSEQGVGGGAGYAAYLRWTDGSAAVRLGEG